MYRKSNFLLLIVFTFLLMVSASAQTVRFKVNVDGSLAKEPLSGRLLIFMTNNPKPLDGIEPDFMNPEAVYITGMEVNNFDANKTIEINPDLLAFPRKFSDAPAGDYQIMALLD